MLTFAGIRTRLYCALGQRNPQFCKPSPSATGVCRQNCVKQEFEIIARNATNEACDINPTHDFMVHKLSYMSHCLFSFPLRPWPRDRCSSSATGHPQTKTSGSSTLLEKIRRQCALFLANPTHLRLWFHIRALTDCIIDTIGSRLPDSVSWVLQNRHGSASQKLRVAAIPLNPFS
jgi:hypothetical protein